ncbi:MAG: Stk1 family PASTA domain-containing Ser/Thr kinase [Cutibacterium granulosum]|nr:Stk1 family PASTA domain-containing Ser/Thr kinase [Cutibacterium granulosum]
MSDSTTWLGDRYELLDIIGRGGMAEVWQARDHRLGRLVAVKRLRVDLASDSTFQARFQREAQSAAGLNHPNIVAVYDTGETTDPTTHMPVPYIVMELVEGHTLREVLRDGRKILPERALEFCVGVLNALAYSHAAGIVHRDIKPANVMLTRNGSIKVMDFGIARAVADTSATMTQTAAVIGTAQYLSPEQARGETVDNRADIYATGCLLYELLVGRPPFVGDSPVSVAYQHVREVPSPPSTLDPEVTPAMDAVTLKALAKDPEHRYPTATQMREDLERVLTGATPQALLESNEDASPDDQATLLVPAVTAEESPTRTLNSTPAHAAPGGPVGDDVANEDETKPRKKWPIILAIVLVLAAAGTGFALWHAHRSGSPAPSPTPQVKMVKVPAVKGLSNDGAISTLKNAGLTAEVKHTKSDRDTANQVLKQSPEAGKSVPMGTTVTITVNDGPGQHTVPKLKRLEESEARQALKDAGFSDAEIRVQDDDPKSEDPKARLGTVTDVWPSPGSKVDDGTTVTLTLATGKSVVPDVKDQPRSQAEENLKKAGFAVAASPGNASPNDQVESQSPSAGTVLDRGETVTLNFPKPQSNNTQPTEQPSTPDRSTEPTTPDQPSQTDQPSEPTEPSEEGDPTER